MTEDYKNDLDREEDQDDYDMGGGLDVEETPDPDHALLDELLEKDRGAASPPKSKSKPRSTGDHRPSKDADLEEEDQESEADTSADDTHGSFSTEIAAIMLLLIVPGLEEPDILDQVVILMVKARATTVVVEVAGLLWIRLECLLFRRCFRDAILLLITCASLAANRLPMSFETTVDSRLGFLIGTYSAVEFQDLIAYWESTHRFPVSPALIHSDPFLSLFVVERKNRWSHAGARWKQILRLFLIAMREGWCDLDLLLDLYFLHFPKQTVKWLVIPGSRLAVPTSRIRNYTVGSLQI
ncbi:hypothetical protein PHMEG_00027698 [Phytophthora megakarya]|uniref:Uncharacterized protein n=1 Tax=Phytophthora megakarya TaxID=4795 RepID=A0A225V501_9STRA|nr:hypothetical protein PHMEG_00027698 [Phytophthora megakarya]